MDAFTSGLKRTTEGLAQGVEDVSSGIGKGVEGVGNAVGHGLKGFSGEDNDPHTRKDNHTSQSANPNKTEEHAPDNTQPEHASHPPPQDTAGSVLGTFTSGVSSVLSPAAGVITSGAALARDATEGGWSIGQKIAHSGLDMGADVVAGSASLAGTALGGIVAQAAETSGAVFEPVASGLKTIQGLDKLGQGIEAINGLSLGAVKQISELTTKALNMSGKTPTFFDPDADGVVTVPDTVRGLVLLGLDEKNAKYAAYALHGVFSYSTSDSWVPGMDSNLPIHVANLGRTRWGKNWGQFDRVEWVEDIEIDKFLVPDKEQKQLSDYWKQGRQGFGALLLIFEWGTTWPFYMPSIPVQQIPFANDIGTVVRKAILPTIIANFKKAKQEKPESKGKETSSS